MYYPKSQIKTALYTNGGEFARTDNDQDYKGYYWTNSSEQYFSGKTPQDIPNILLQKQQTEDSEHPSTPQSFSAWVDEAPNGLSETKPGLSPNKFYPTPSEEDYKLGQFTRYFTKKTNQNIYYEISKEDYDRLQAKDSTIKWQLYLGIKLKWELTGDKNGVYKTNKNIVMQTELNQRLPLFSKIFRKDYLQYYKD